MSEQYEVIAINGCVQKPDGSDWTLEEAQEFESAFLALTQYSFGGTIHFQTGEMSLSDLDTHMTEYDLTSETLGKFMRNVIRKKLHPKGACPICDDWRHALILRPQW